MPGNLVIWILSRYHYARKLHVNGGAEKKLNWVFVPNYVSIIDVQILVQREGVKKNKSKRMGCLLSNINGDDGMEAEVKLC